MLNKQNRHQKSFTIKVFIDEESQNLLKEVKHSEKVTLIQIIHQL